MITKEYVEQLFLDKVFDTRKPENVQYFIDVFPVKTGFIAKLKYERNVWTKVETIRTILFRRNLKAYENGKHLFDFEPLIN